MPFVSHHREASFVTVAGIKGQRQLGPAVESNLTPADESGLGFVKGFRTATETEPVRTRPIAVAIRVATELPLDAHPHPQIRCR